MSEIFLNVASRPLMGLQRIIKAAAERFFE
jgi:hypothetical protein